MVGRRSPQSPSISRLTSPPDRILSKCRRSRHRIPTPLATAPVRAQLNFVGANLRSDAVAAPHGRTPGLDRDNPPTCRKCSASSLGGSPTRRPAYFPRGNSMIGLYRSALVATRQYLGRSDVCRLPYKRKGERRAGTWLFHSSQPLPALRIADNLQHHRAGHVWKLAYRAAPMRA